MSNRRMLFLFTLAMLVCEGFALALVRYGGACATAGQWLRLGAGLGMVLFVPGVQLAALAFGPFAVGWAAFVCAAVGLNFAAIIALSTAIKLAGLVVTPESYLAAAALASGALAVALAFRARPAADAANGSVRVWHVGLAAAAIAGYVALVQRPVPMSEDDFLTPDCQWRLEQLEFADAAETPATASWLSPVQRLGKRLWRLRPGSSAYQVQTQAKPAHLRWLVRSTAECLLSLKDSAGRVLGAYYFHPRFNIKVHPRNYPPNTQFVDVALPGGSTRVEVDVRSSRPGCELELHDLTGLSKRKLLGYVRKRFAIWDIGDVREQLNLARNLRDHLLPFTYSYDGTVFDGGGYSIGHLPLRSYVGMAALVLLGDGMASFVVVWVGQLALIFLLACALGRARSWAAMGCALLAVLAYATLVRPNVEGACLRTTSILTVLGAAYFLFWKRDEGEAPRPVWPVVLFAALSCLSKVGLMMTPALLFIHALLSNHASRRLRIGLAAGAGTLVAAALAAFVVGQLLGVWGTWWATFLGDSFVGKFSILLTILTGSPQSADFVRLGPDACRCFFGAAADYSWWVLVGACFLPLAVIVGRDKPALTLLLTGAFGYLVVAASDPSLIIPGIYCSHYFTRVAGVTNVLAVGGLRCLTAHERNQRWAIAWLAAGIAALPLAAREHVRQDAALASYPWHGAIYKAAVIDFLKRRASDHFTAGRIAETRDDCYKMLLVDSTYVPTMLLLANCDQWEGKWEAAARKYESALTRPAELDDATEFASNCLNAAGCYVKLGNAERARHWLDQATGSDSFAASALATQAAAVRSKIDALAPRSPTRPAAPH